MAYIQRIKREFTLILNSQKGIALFMVLMAVATLSVMAVEFTYESSVNLKTSYDQLHRLRATYLAKSGLKLSYLRLKAYQKIKGLISNTQSQGGLAAAAVSQAVPRNLLEMLWNIPLPFPIDNIPGLSLNGIQKSKLAKFNKESGLSGGSFVAKIQSESNRYNLNLLITPYMVAASGTPDDSASPTPSPSPKPNASPSGKPNLQEEFKPEEARKSFRTFMEEIFKNKLESDDEFAANYQSFLLDDLIDDIVGWVDFTYQPTANKSGDFAIPRKMSSFYSVTELNMLANMDDTLYELFSPNLTASRTSGINVNTMGKQVFQAMVPGLTEEEVKLFFEFRDSVERDNKFRNADEFFKYLEENVAAYSGSSTQDLKEKLAERNIKIITDETEFTISVVSIWETAQVLMEAKVRLEDEPKPKEAAAPGVNNPGATAPPALPPGALPPPPPTGLKVISVRTL